MVFICIFIFLLILYICILWREKSRSVVEGNILQIYCISGIFFCVKVFTCFEN